MLAWTVATIQAGDEVSPLFEHWFYRIGMIGLFLVTLAFFKYTVWKLNRLDVTHEYIFISNYMKTFRYSIDSISSIKPYSIGWMKFLKIKLKEKGSMGDSFTVLIESVVWNQYLISHPQYQPLIKSSGA